MDTSSRRKYFSPAFVQHTSIIGFGLCLALLASRAPLLDAIKITCCFCLVVLSAGVLICRDPLPGNLGGRANADICIIFGASLAPALLFAFFVSSSFSNTLLISACVFSLLIAFLTTSSSFMDRERIAWETCLPVLFASIVAPIDVLAMEGAPSVDYHTIVQAIAARSLAYGWPPGSPFIGGLPLGSNYGLHLLLFSMSQLTRIPIGELVANAAPTLLVWLAIFSTVCLGRHWLSLSPVASLAAAAAAYLVVGFSPIALGWLGNAIPAAGIMTFSPLLGHVIYISTGALLVTSTREADQTGKLLLSVCFLLLGFSASFVRANSGALLASTSSAYWLYLVCLRRRVDLPPTLYTFLIGAGALAGIAATLGMPGVSSFSSAGFIRLSFGGGAQFLDKVPFIAITTLARQAGIPPSTAGVLAFLVFTLFSAQFLSPLLWWRIWRSRRSIDPADAFLLCGFALGFLLTFSTEAPGGSQFVFQQTGIICACLVGARGLDDLLRLRKAGPLTPLGKSLAIATSIGFVIHLSDASRQMVELGPVQHLFAERPIEQAQAKVKPLLDHIDDLSTTYFLIAESEALTSNQALEWMATFGLKRVATQDLLQYYERFDQSNKVARLAEAIEAFLARSKLGTVDLNCAYDVAKLSFVFGKRIVIISSSTSVVVPNEHFRRVAETSDFSAWEIVYGPEKSAGCRER
jgi:hypothetical protein